MTDLKYQQFDEAQERAAVQQRLMQAESEHFRLQLDAVVNKVEGGEPDSEQLAKAAKVVKALQAELEKLPAPEQPAGPVAP